MPNNKPIRRVPIIPCACRKSNTYIQMMKSADWLSLPVLVLVAILVVLAGITHALIGVRTRAQARCAVMAIRLTCARWQNLEDEQIPGLRKELHSNRPNGSGTNKIVGSRSATPCSIDGSIRRRVFGPTDRRGQQLHHRAFRRQARQGQGGRRSCLSRLSLIIGSPRMMRTWLVQTETYDGE
jgi:hypothetical protein